MPLQNGTRIGSYEVVSAIGAGGMGEVYRGRDTKLGRDVAIKALPALFAGDAERRARFAREAQLLAALHHPNIAGIYGLEEDGGATFLILEYIGGMSLAERLGAGPLPLEEALAIARQIAEALEAAHEKGIVHRDLKPANIMLTAEGQAKVLDFGLARAAAVSVSGSAMNSPTLTFAATEAGVILGTAAYMAPEQAKGKTVDRRADIWAFGVVLFEMLTGARPFGGETMTETIAAILKEPASWEALPREVPPAVRALLERTLVKDPRQRLRDIGDARLALEDIQSGRIAPAAAPIVVDVRRRRWPLIVPWVLAAVASLAAILAVTRPAAAPADGTLFVEIGPPPDTDLIVGSNAGGVVISPDGTAVAFLAQTPAGRRLFVRSLTTGESRPLPGTGDAHYPFWSPDSRSLGFFGSTKLLTIAVAGGQPEAVAEIELGRGGSWSDTGVILFTPQGGGVVHRVPAGGGTVEAVTSLDASRGENAHYWPVALPGGTKFLFFVRSTRPENNGIYLGAFDKSPPVRLVTALSSGLYAPPREGRPGSLLWVRDGQLLAQPLDADAARLTGDVTTIASEVRVEDSQRIVFASVSNTGRLVWAPARAGDFNFAWYDRGGRRLDAVAVPPGKIMQPRLSPDDKKLAFARAVEGTADVWVHDFASAATTQVTTDPGYDENASWSPDGRRLIHQGRGTGAEGLVIATADGSQPPQVAVRGVRSTSSRFLPDGRHLVYSRWGENNSNNLVLAAIDRPEATTELTTDVGQEFAPAPSPDGRWLTFVTTRAARYEVVLARLIADTAPVRLGPQLPVSSAGGADPHWRRDGREIIYLAADRTLMSVSVAFAGDGATLGKPQPLFKVLADAGGWGSSWTATAAFDKFVVVEAPRAAGQRFVLLNNWTAVK